MVGEHAPEPWRLQDLLALLGRHRPQVSKGRFHHLAPLRRKLLHLRVDLAYLLSLVGSQVFPHLGTAQNSLLLLGWQAVQLVQPVLQALLLLTWQAPELRIIALRFLLFRWSEGLMCPQPVANVLRALCLRWTRHFVRVRTARLGIPGLWRARHLVRLRRRESGSLSLPTGWRLRHLAALLLCES
jgi:hypothetical protein